MEIKLATIEDGVEFESLNQKFNHEPGRKYTELISLSDKFMFVAKENNKIVGFSGVEKSEWNNTARGITVFVHPDHRRKKIGSALVKEMIAKAEELDVRCLIVEAPSKSNALPLYGKSGFRKCGYNDRYYSNDGDETAIFLSYDFNNEDKE